MSLAEKSIVVEDKLGDIFSYLPAMGYGETATDKFNVTFGFGDSKELNAFLKLKHKANNDPYPLIWLLYPYKEEHLKNKVVLKDINLIISVKTNSSMRNKQRIEETYKNVLYPLFDNIRHALDKASNTNSAREYNIVKHPNFSSTEEGDEHAGVFIWDAIKINFGLTIMNNCLKKIIF